MARSVKQVQLAIGRSQDKIAKFSERMKSEKGGLSELRIELKDARVATKAAKKK